MLPSIRWHHLSTTHRGRQARASCPSKELPTCLLQRACLWLGSMGIHMPKLAELVLTCHKLKSDHRATAVGTFLASHSARSLLQVLQTGFITSETSLTIDCHIGLRETSAAQNNLLLKQAMQNPRLFVNNPSVAGLWFVVRLRPLRPRLTLRMRQTSPPRGPRRLRRHASLTGPVQAGFASPQEARPLQAVR